jgi:hypothetical protein
LRSTLRLALGAHGDSVRGLMIWGTSGTLVLTAINSGLMLLISLALARALGAAGYGAYAYTISWVSLLTIPATLGFNRLLTREFASYRAAEDWGAMHGILRWSDRLVLSLSVMIAAAGAAGVWWSRQHLDPMVANCLLAICEGRRHRRHEQCVLQRRADSPPLASSGPRLAMPPAPCSGTLCWSSGCGGAWGSVLPPSALRRRGSSLPTDWIRGLRSFVGALQSEANEAARSGFVARYEPDAAPAASG